MTEGEKTWAVGDYMAMMLVRDSRSIRLRSRLEGQPARVSSGTYDLHHGLVEVADAHSPWELVGRQESHARLTITNSKGNPSSCVLDKRQSRSSGQPEHSWSMASVLQQPLPVIAMGAL